MSPECGDPPCAGSVPEGQPETCRDTAAGISAEWARRILATSLNGMYVRDIKANVNVFVNAECVRLTGYTLDRLNALGPYDFLALLHGEDRGRVLDHWSALKTAQDGDVTNIEYRFRRADGQWIWCLSRDAVLQRDADGSVRFVAGTILDISEQKQLLATVRDSEGRFRSMADELPLIVWVHDGDGNVEFVNRAFCQFFGVSAHEMHGDRWHLLMHPEDAEACLAEFRASARERRPFHAEVRVRRADGRWRLVECWARPRFSAGNAFAGFFGTSVDITDRREAEDALRQSEERLRLLIDSTNDAIYDWDIVNGTIWWNEAFTDRFQAGESERSLSAWAARIHPDDRDRVMESLDHACNEPAADWSDEYRFRRTDGTWVYVLDRCHISRDARGRAVRAVGAMVDLTERKRAEDRLQEDIRRKDEFLATLAHELRNPLAPIQAGINTLQRAGYNPEVADRALATMQRQTLMVIRLVDDLVDISRITRGKISLQTEQVDVCDIIGVAVETGHASINNFKERTLCIDLPRQPLTVRADPVRLAQIFGNLLDNAVKYTAAGGGIWISAARDGDQAVITVRDDGKGMEAHMVDHVFDMFAQANPGRAGGLGIGLTLARHLARLHGGDIRARSEGAGRGSSFELRLRLADCPEPAAGATSAGSAVASPLRSRVLVVDDNRDVADSFAMLLEVLGAEVQVAYDGHGALSLLDAFRPKVVFLDLGMAEMDGFEVARRIRTRADGQPIVIVALTGWSHDEVRRQVIEYAFDHHLVKPATLAAVQAILASLGEEAPGS
jgi:PAS domain S-box-containing protein